MRIGIKLKAGIGQILKKGNLSKLSFGLNIVRRALP
jgi:hypothetical protein